MPIIFNSIKVMPSINKIATLSHYNQQSDETGWKHNQPWCWFQQADPIMVAYRSHAKVDLVRSSIFLYGRKCKN